MSRPTATFLNEPPSPPAPERPRFPLPEMRPARLQCGRCSFRFEVRREVEPEDLISCPRCRVVAVAEPEPPDSTWWTWAMGGRR